MARAAARAARRLHGHIEDTAPSGLVTALAAARAAPPTGASWSAPSTPTLDRQSLPAAGARAACRARGRRVPAALRPGRSASVRLQALRSAPRRRARSIRFRRCADACAEAGVWLHVDAAYAGSGRLSGAAAASAAGSGGPRSASTRTSCSWLRSTARRSDSPRRRPPPRVQPRAGLPAVGRRRREPE